MSKQIKVGLHRLASYYAYLLIVWGFFRLLFKFPDLIEEVWFKPIIWLLPLLLLWFPEAKKLPFFKGKMLPSIVFGLGLGAFYLVVLFLTGLGKGHFTLAPVLTSTGFWEFAGISLVTAICEEVVFSGYIFQKLSQSFKKESISMGITLVLFALIHIPISLFIYKYSFIQLAMYLSLVTIVAWGNLFAMSKSKNVIAPILSHWMWGLGVMMFR